MSDDEPPKPKPLKKCDHCLGEKKDAFWTVTYHRYICGRDEPLKVRGVSCDEHLAVACCRASSKLRIYPRFVHGPGGCRIMPNGMVSAARPT